MILLAIPFQRRVFRITTLYIGAHAVRLKYIMNIFEKKVHEFFSGKIVNHIKVKYNENIIERKTYIYITRLLSRFCIQISHSIEK